MSISSDVPRFQQSALSQRTSLGGFKIKPNEYKAPKTLPLQETTTVFAQQLHKVSRILDE